MIDKAVRNRMTWAISQSSPKCVRCTVPVESHDLAIRINYSDTPWNANTPISGVLYFHASCYNVEFENARKAQSIFFDMLMSRIDWTIGFIRMNRVAPFRFLMPGRLEFGEVMA